MRIKIMTLMLMFVLCLSGCEPKQSAEVNILATADLHSLLPEALVSYVETERKKDKNLTLVDAGDFFDIQSKQMWEWFWGKELVKVEDGFPTYKTVAKEREGEAPIAREMGRLRYDAVVLGNHEFVANDKESLDILISDFQNNHIPLISANTYESNGESYTKPYIMKEIPTDEGNIKLGILGLTIKEVGERSNQSRELKDLEGYQGKLYMNDLVEDAKKWVSIMKKDNADIIVTVVHSGEKPKKPKNPGNRIQDLAQQVEGIDVIVAAHTHVRIAQHDYKNKAGETVIVTQPGKHGECISKINFKLLKENNRNWKVTDKTSSIVSF